MENKLRSGRDGRHKSCGSDRLSSALMCRLIAVLCLSVFGLAGPVQDGAQGGTPGPSGESGKAPTLAELARKEKERRTEKDVRVIRNEDLGALRKARVATGQTTRASAGSGEAGEEADEMAAEPDAEGEAGLDLTFWEGAFSQARTALVTAVNQKMVLELRMNSLRNAYFQQPDGVTRERIEGELAKTFTEVEQAREDEKAARQAIADLERQAARAGLTSGQIRDLVGQLPESKSMVEGVPEAGGQGVPE